MDLLAANPLAQRLDQVLTEGVRSRYFSRMEFATPAGDQGWFGPDSAVCHVHGHLPALFLGLTAATFIENLHPSIAWMGYDHSRLVERVDGVPTGRIDAEGAKVRIAHSLAFFLGTAYGSTATAERVSRAVRAMHHTIKGTRPDGVPYDADDPDWLRWNYATVVWGLASAHERYHPRPVEDIDDYYGQMVRVGEALGGTDLPATRDDVLAYLESELPKLALTPIAAARTWPVLRDSTPRAMQPLEWLLDWARKDMLPPWGQKLVLYRPHRPGHHLRPPPGGEGAAGGSAPQRRPAGRAPPGPGPGRRDPGRGVRSPRPGPLRGLIVAPAPGSWRAPERCPPAP